MRTLTRSILVAVLLVALATAVPVALWRPYGWFVAAGVALAGAFALTAYVGRRVLDPLTDAARTTTSRDIDPELRAEDLARMIASEHRAALEKLETALAAGRRQKAALAHAADGAVLMDPDGNVEYANPVARWLVHDRVLDVSRRIGQPELEGLVRQALEDGKPVTAELTLRIPEARHVVARAIPLADSACVLLFQDRTEANRLDQMRRDFVANVSHELKTPVAAIRALADVVGPALEDPDPDTALRFVARLQKEAERLAQLVLDLLDLSKVEAAGRELELAPVELRQLLDAAAEQARPVADAKGVALEVSGGPLTVDADAAQLGMAVQNLVDNAVRYSDEGTVRLSVDADDDGVSITVADDGIGIPTSELPRIFERFYRVDRARSRATGGTGLGLAIVRHVVENHGGRVEVSSELGRGSTFTVRLPGAASEGNAA